MDIHEWEIRFQVCLIECGVETIVEGSVFRWTPDEEKLVNCFFHSGRELTERIRTGLLLLSTTPPE